MRKLSILGIFFALALSSNVYAQDSYECEKYPDRCPEYQKADSIQVDDINENDESDAGANYNNSRSNKSNIRSQDDTSDENLPKLGDRDYNDAQTTEIDDCKWDPAKCKQEAEESEKKANYNNTRSNKAGIQTEIDDCKWDPAKCKQKAEESEKKANYNNTRSNKAGIQKDLNNDDVKGRSYNNSRSNRSTISDKVRKSQILKKYAVRNVIVKKYENAFRNKLKGRINNLTSEQLKKIDSRINTMLTNTKNNGSKNLARKQALLSALVALKNIFAEEMNKKSDDTMNLLEEVMQ